MENEFHKRWARLAVIDSRLKTIDAEWHKLLLERKKLISERMEPPPGVCTRKRLNWEQAEARAKEINELRANGLSHNQIAAKLNLNRPLVAYYLSENFKKKHSSVFI